MPARTLPSGAGARAVIPLALLGAVVIGLCVGVLGAGGSILTVPVLVYLLGMDEKVAITSALAIVGSIALVGALPHALAGRVDWKVAAAFGPAAMVAAFGAAFIGQHLSGVLQLLLLGGILCFTSVRMFLPIPAERLGSAASEHRPNWGGLVLRGALVGAITGLVGIGGGFLIVPALAVLGRLPMHRAVATSLVLIPLQAWSAFAKHYIVLRRLELRVDWDEVFNTVGIFILIGGFATLLGGMLAGRIPQRVLRRSFAITLAIIGGYMIVVESIALLGRASA